MKLQPIRPQVLVSVVLLGVIAVFGLHLNINEIAGVATAGIIALAKDVITTDGQ